MTALDDLRDYAAALKEKRAIERQMERMGITGAPKPLHGIAGGEPGTNDRTAAAIQALDGLEARLMGIIEELVEKAKRGEDALRLISYDRARIVMRYAYVMEMNDAQIARELQISRGSVQRIRQATERELEGISVPP